MTKVRRIDWSPDEWIAGTRDLTVPQAAIYMAVLMIIYSRGGKCPNDAPYVARQFAGCHWRTAQQAIADLIALGKLRVTHSDADGLQYLTNGRADVELDRAVGRISSSHKAAAAAGRVHHERAEGRRGKGARLPHERRTTLAQRSHEQSKPAHINGLAEPGGSYHQPSPSISSFREINTGSARAAAPHPSGSAPRTTSPVPRLRPTPRIPGDDGKPVGPPDPEAVEKSIRELGIDPASVETPPPPAQNAPVVPAVPVAKSAQTRPTTAERLAEKAAAARRKLMGGT